MKFPSINSNKEFQYLYRKGAAVAGRYCIAYFKKRGSRGSNSREGIRLGITASKKVGNAVQRNRARRVIRASFESIAPSLFQNLDIVIVARSAIVGEEVKSGNVKSFFEQRLVAAVNSAEEIRVKKSGGNKYAKNVKTGGVNLPQERPEEQSHSTNVKHDRKIADESAAESEKVSE